MGKYAFLGLLLLVVAMSGCATVPNPKDDRVWIIEKLDNDVYAMYMYALVGSTSAVSMPVNSSNEEKLPHYVIDSGKYYALCSTTPFINDLRAPASISQSNSNYNVMNGIKYDKTLTQPDFKIKKYQPPPPPIFKTK